MLFHAAALAREFINTNCFGPRDKGLRFFRERLFASAPRRRTIRAQSRVKSFISIRSPALAFYSVPRDQVAAIFCRPFGSTPDSGSDVEKGRGKRVVDL